MADVKKCDKCGAFDPRTLHAIQVDHHMYEVCADCHTVINFFKSSGTFVSVADYKKRTAHHHWF